MSADHPNAADQPGYGSDPGVPQVDAGGGTFNDHINAHMGIKSTQSIGTSVIVEYNDGSSEVLPRDVFGTSASAGGSGAGLGWAQLANTQANQAAAQAGQQASLAETIRQFNEQMGMDKARGDQQMRLSQQQADQKNAMDQENYQLALRRFGLDQQSQDFSQYTKLADLASNPRNYVQTFFMNRGFQAPVDVARYGNTPSNASQILPFQQWQAQRQAAPISGVMNGGMEQMPTNAPVGGYGGQNNPNNPYAGTNINYGGSPTQADTAMINGVKTWAGGPYSGKPVDQSPANAGDLTPYLQAGQRAQMPKMMARGGNVTMYVPHALVNLATGRTVAIAGEKGMETAHFDGAAIIDPLADKNIGEAVPMPDYTTPPDQTPAPTPTQPTYSPTGPSVSSSTTPTGAGTTQTGPAFGLTPELLAQAQALAAQATAANAASLAKQTMTQATQPTPQAFQMPGITNGGLEQMPSLTDLVTPGTPGGPVSYGDSISPQTPTYLSGENFQAASPITTALQNTPFLKRLYGQARGDQNYGTDRPQRTDLPPDLPLISQLAWAQLSPSEQQGFLSYVSSLGVDPNDYLDMIRQSSPHGGSASSPSFGNNIPFTSQNY